MIIGKQYIARKPIKPEILTHPHIPKPLHGLNPRTILGKDWWDKVRLNAQEINKFKCVACGTHKSELIKYKWLEGHEYWDINYHTGKCEVKSIEPLCHYCHNFIHSGRLSMIIGKEKTKQEIIDILEHGFKILSEHNLKAFPFTIDLAKEIGANNFKVEAYNIDVNPKIKWSDFKMILEGKEYSSKFKNEEEWSNFY